MMKTRRMLIGLTLLMIGMSSVALAQLSGTTFYIDFVGGDDTNTGTSEITAWKHAPGDPNATANAASVILASGDTILLKGGVVYRGMITTPAHGTAGNPITYKGDGWGTAKAVIDGSEPLAATWMPCSSAAECGGNPHWANIWHADINYTRSTNPWVLNLIENDVFCHVAQSPSPVEPFYYDEKNDYYVPEGITTTTVTDSRLALLGGTELAGKYALTYEGNNSVLPHLIASFDPATNTITVTDTIDVTYTGPDARYAVANHALFLDAPGEYVFESATQPDGTHRLLLWPRIADPNTGTYTVSVRDYGIKVSKNYVMVAGLVGRRCSIASTGAGGNAIAASGLWGSGLLTGVVVRDCVIEQNRNGIGPGYGLYVKNCNQCVIEDNLVQDNPRHRGIVVQNVDQVQVINNDLRHNGGTVIWVVDSSRTRVVGNVITESSGSHANGFACYGIAGVNDTVLVAHNRIENAGIIQAAFQNSKNVVLFGNLLLEGNANGGIFRNWGGLTGTNLVINNTMHHSVNHSALGLGNSAQQQTFRVWNNILDGAGNKDASRSYNLYVGLQSDQQPVNGWMPGIGEIVDLSGSNYVAVDPATVFVNPASDYRLKPGSRAINAGTDTVAYLHALAQTDSNVQAILDAFPDFDWTKDIAGNVYGADGTWDIGAYEYVGSVYLLWTR